MRFRPGGIGNWSGHLPFASDLLCALQPELIVELGTHYGESYFGLCQTIAENNIGCTCYAVDSWVGERHAGAYDNSVFEEVNRYNDALYSRFSYLLRTTFDEAAANFSEGSIDVLHIDGLHTYEAVSHDFHTWYPKVKAGGVILLHDISARHEDFGVWKFWNEVQSFGNCFSFHHSWGLGVHQKAGECKSGKLFLQSLFDSTPEYKEYIRRFYSLCALRLEYQHYRQNESRIHVQTFPYVQNGYSADVVINSDLAPESWQEVFIDITPSAGNGPLRFDPADRPGLIDISSIVVRSLCEDVLVWSGGPAEIANLSTGGTIVRLASADGEDYCRFLSYGPDPQIFLPSLDGPALRNPVVLQVRLRIQSGLASLIPLLRPPTTSTQVQLNAMQDIKSLTSQHYALRAQVDALTAECDFLVQERKSLAESKIESEKRHQDLIALYETLSARADTLTKERDSLIWERDSLAASFKTLQTELYITKTDDKRTAAAMTELQKGLATTKSQLSECQARHAELEARRGELEARCAELEARRVELEETLKGVLKSRSWRLTALMRDWAFKIRGSAVSSK